MGEAWISVLPLDSSVEFYFCLVILRVCGFWVFAWFQRLNDRRPCVSQMTRVLSSIAQTISLIARNIWSQKRQKFGLGKSMSKRVPLSKTYFTLSTICKFSFVDWLSFTDLIRPPNINRTQSTKYWTSGLDFFVKRFWNTDLLLRTIRAMLPVHTCN